MLGLYPLILTFDPNFLQHPSIVLVGPLASVKNKVKVFDYSMRKQNAYIIHIEID